VTRIKRDPLSPYPQLYIKKRFLFVERGIGAAGLTVISTNAIM